MKLRKFKSNEHGAVVVLVALSLTALFGFTALAVDFGMMASNKQGMQNACDAAALAAALDIKNGSDGTVTSTGYTYTAINGFDNNDDDTQVTVTRNGNQVTVTIQQEMQMGFSGVLTGERTRTVSATATAESTSIFGRCPYALFAETIIDFGQSTYIYGDVHCNGELNLEKAELKNGSVASTALDPKGVQLKSGTVYPEPMYKAMPSFSHFEKALDASDHHLVVFDSDPGNIKMDAFISQALSKFRSAGGTDAELQEKGLYIYVKDSIKKLKKDSYTPTFPITLIADDDIAMHGDAMSANKDYPFYIMSRNGHITVSGGDKNMVGIVYAPKGDITLDGAPFVFDGSIVGQSIIKNSAKATITYWEDADSYLPDAKVHLVS